MAQAERILLATPQLSGRGSVIASPFQWLFGGDDALRIVVLNALTGVTVTIQGRFLWRDKGENPFVFTVTPTADRLATTKDFPLGDGFLLNLSVNVTSGAPLLGQTYVMIQILRGSSGAKLLLGCLIAGYVTALQHLAFPGSPFESSISGGGVIRNIGGTQPALGAEILETVPTGARWQLLAWTMTLAAGGAGVARRPLLYFAAGGSPFCATLSPLAIAPGATVSFYWGQGLTVVANIDPLFGMAGLPSDLPLLAGHVIGSFTTNLGPVDAYTRPFYQVREWLEAA